LLIKGRAVIERENWLEMAIGEAIERVRRIDATAVDFPHITETMKWQFTTDGVWTGGFWAGLLWLCAAHESDERLKERASHFTDRLLPRANDKQNHDLGFMFAPSAVKAWKLFGETGYRDAARMAARTLASQYNPIVGFIPGWGYFGGDDWSGNVLIDTLMNLPLVVWAVNEGEDRRLLEVVRGHAGNTIRHLMRENGSVFHMYRFASDTGEPLGGDTYQGHAPHSTWSRGQAWALTGLAMLGQMLRNNDYLTASERAASYFLSALPEDGIPPWDFHAPDGVAHRDSSAGAIASYGLLRLSDATGKPSYLKAANRLLSALARDCANRGQEGGLLLHATADLPHGHGIDESVMYGDFYYLKSLLGLRERACSGQMPDGWRRSKCS
jgi:unsaturated chondroitin disaccharide hydrolase